MNRIFAYFTLAVFCMALFAGCAAYSVSPVTGFFYTDVKGPMAVTSNTGFSKVGVAKAQSILGWFANGDASIAAAMENGGIQKIHHVDFHSNSILGIIATFEVTVYGE